MASDTTLNGPGNTNAHARDRRYKKRVQARVVRHDKADLMQGMAEHDRGDLGLLTDEDLMQVKGATAFVMP